VVSLESLQVVSLLGVLPLVLNTEMGGVVSLRRRGGTAHGLPLLVLVLLLVERVGSPIVVTVVVFVEVGLIGEMFWSVLIPLWSKWLSIGFTLLLLTPVLSRLFTHVLIFDFQVGDLKNIWLIDSGCLFREPLPCTGSCPRLRLAFLATMRPVLDPAGHQVPEAEPTCLSTPQRPR
jgi:hypothetical protein